MVKLATVFVAAFFLSFISPLTASANGVRFVSRPMPVFRPMPMMRSMPVFRPAPMMRPAVIRQGYVPRVLPEFQNRAPIARGVQFGRREFNPGVFQGIRPGRPIVVGRFGQHPVRNQTKWAVIGHRAGLVFTGADGTVTDGPLDIEQMVDDTDLSAPLEPVSGCTGNCKWGAIAISNDGASGTAWNYNSADEARAAAMNNCVSAASEQCYGYVAVGTAWMAGVQCEIFAEDGSSVHRSSVSLGDDLGAAIRNTFRLAVQDGTFSLDQCALRTYAAANGAQTIIDQPAPEPQPIVAANPEALPQPPVIEARSVAEELPGEGFYAYNGSTFYIQKVGDKTAFYYNDPRKGLAVAGIKHGSLLYEGTLQNAEFKGYGVTYLKNCPAVKYEMTGTVSRDGTTISLSGTQPSRDKLCRTMSYKDARITFTSYKLE